ncbi:type II secretion system minor pseudopilin GspJ [Erwinia tracheiphila]|uniref:Type II secretion system protein J n=1 Tax=Erwinia tracheiphila TaxID=65700 RepID=A0A0M2KH81_9GAMM|nr:type II secretion system minor pseudopilin GspJ [Erwinia tracheiphila]AXF77716.1 type II secretion system protein GspJ [Erwinia tracheiphila]EOS93521.1 general secretion pathway protein J [Erwinia tracheiphila PSU-1]KKF36583.1 general secretion pathway protein GspJ [Erwinia tracheiphila]UIA83598.1 type II secretion system minor pseudopilin GspJ [Erwinia tracheiphila]UIA87916.1 type II secretion system minor pseudopilin GspJ [Erwinia tracheiphila]
MNRQRGFTLLEMLLGMTLIAIVSLSAWYLLAGMSRSQQMMLSKGGKLKAINRVFNILSDDFSHAVMRTRAKAGATDLQLQTGDVSLVRLLRKEPRSAGVQLEQVEWYLQNNTLYRRSWLLAPGVQVINQRQLAGVSVFHLRFYQQGLWQPQLLSGDTLPQAVEITLAVNGLGEVQRLTLMGEQ